MEIKWIIKACYPNSFSACKACSTRFQKNCLAAPFLRSVLGWRRRSRIKDRYTLTTVYCRARVSRNGKVSQLFFWLPKTLMVFVPVCSVNKPPPTPTQRNVCSVTCGTCKRGVSCVFLSIFWLGSFSRVLSLACIHPCVERFAFSTEREWSSIRNVGVEVSLSSSVQVGEDAKIWSKAGYCVGRLVKTFFKRGPRALDFLKTCHKLQFIHMEWNHFSPPHPPSPGKCSLLSLSLKRKRATTHPFQFFFVLFFLTGNVWRTAVMRWPPPHYCFIIFCKTPGFEKYLCHVPPPPQTKRTVSHVSFQKHTFCFAVHLTHMYHNVMYEMHRVSFISRKQVIKTSPLHTFQSKPRATVLYRTNSPPKVTDHHLPLSSVPPFFAIRPPTHALFVFYKHILDHTWTPGRLDFFCTAQNSNTACTHYFALLGQSREHCNVPSLRNQNGSHCSFLNLLHSLPSRRRRHRHRRCNLTCNFHPLAWHAFSFPSNLGLHCRNWLRLRYIGNLKKNRQFSKTFSSYTVHVNDFFLATQSSVRQLWIQIRRPSKPPVRRTHQCLTSNFMQ